MRHMPDGLNRIDTFEKAKRYVESTRPYMKGRSKGQVPLGSQRRYDRSLITFRDGAYFLNYYANPVVTLYEDGRKRFSNCGWPSVSTVSFLQETSRSTDISFIGGAGKNYAIIKGIMYLVSDHRNETPLIVDADNNVVSCVHETKHVLDNEAFKNLKKRYVDFIKYVCDIVTLSHDVSDIVIVETRGDMTLTATPHRTAHFRGSTHKQMRDKFFYELDQAGILANEDKLSAYYKLATLTIRGAAHFIWNTELVKYEAFASPKNVREFFYKLLKFQFANHVFRKEIIQPNSKVVFDDNLKYVQYQNQ